MVLPNEYSDARTVWLAGDTMLDRLRSASGLADATLADALYGVFGGLEREVLADRLGVSQLVPLNELRVAAWLADSYLEAADESTQNMLLEDSVSVLLLESGDALLRERAVV